MAGSVAGALILGDMKPEIPKWLNVDPALEQGYAIAGNQRNLAAAAKLGADTNEELITQHLTALERLMPGFSGLNQQIIGNIASQARGEIPQDVQNQMARQAAEMGVTTGTSGSDFDKYRQLRNLGLTSLQLTDQALNSAGRWMQTVTSGAPKFNFANMFISPEMQIQSTFRNRENQWNRDYLKAQVDAMPDAWQRALANLFDNIEESGQAALGSWAGKAMGGGGQGSGSDTGF